MSESEIGDFKEENKTRVFSSTTGVVVVVSVVFFVVVFVFVSKNYWNVSLRL